jgi:glutamyl-Q tRNA(Asp) synthetase
MSAYIGRFAPSPTGPLHAGSLVAALASYLDALAHGGQWLLRIDDADLSRVQPGAASTIAAQLQHYGFVWQGRALHGHSDKQNQSQNQSQRLTHTQDHRAQHAAALARLQQRGTVYACRCTRATLSALPISPIGERVYDRRCQRAHMHHLSHLDGVEGLQDGLLDGYQIHGGAAAQPRALRLSVGDATLSFTDRWAGAQTQHLPTQVGDFVLWRPATVTGVFDDGQRRITSGLYNYQLTMPVDDAAAGVSHIVRGADLLGNTARQLYVYDLLGLPRPSYLHVPIVTTTDGAKLSKQHGAPALPHLPSTAPVPVLNQALAHLGILPSTAVNQAGFWRDAVRGWAALLACPRPPASLSRPRITSALSSPLSPRT